MYLKAIQCLIKYREHGMSLADLLSSAHTKKFQTNRKYLKFIIETVLFLALRGHPFIRGNFLELLNLRAQNMDTVIQLFMKSLVNSYKSPTFQNEIIVCIINEIFADIVQELTESLAYSIICDETTNISVRAQLSICIRYIVKQTATWKSRKDF